MTSILEENVFDTQSLRLYCVLPYYYTSQYKIKASLLTAKKLKLKQIRRHDMKKSNIKKSKALRLKH